MNNYNDNVLDINIQGRVLRIARPELDKYEAIQDPETVLQQLRESDRRIDIFSFMQIMPWTSPQYSYPMEWDNLAVLPISSFDHWWNHQILSYPRNRARQAEKRGATIREAVFDDVLVKGIWEVYNESPIRQGKPNAHYGKDIQTVRRLQGTYLDRSIFIGAFLGEQLIGFAKLVCNESRTQANLMNIVSMVKHRDKAPTNALIAQSVRACADRGIHYLVYQNFIYGKKAPDSLAKFKEVNGFTRINLPRYYVPMTPLGKMALRLQLHHKLVDHLPESVSTKLREFRSAWYNRKFQTTTEAS